MEVKERNKIKLITIIICCLGFIGCETTTSISRNCKKVNARITYYRAGEDKYGSRIACSKLLRAKEGTTIAAESKIPFGTPVHIPALAGIVGDGKFIVQDRGGAVTSDPYYKIRKHGKIYWKPTAIKGTGADTIFDVWVGSKKKFNYLVAHMQPVLEAIIF